MTGQSQLEHTGIDGAEFGGLMAPLGIEDCNPRLAVAVSGGSDSMALAVLTHEWAKARAKARASDVVCLIVDHGLRPESGAEALQVADWLRGEGMNAEVLTWAGPKPKTGIQAGARAARYRLLIERCSAQEVSQLLLAHHQDDQAETFLLRLFRGSGVDGLACMASVSQPPIKAAVEAATQVQLLRPLLSIPKSRLVATLRERGVSWIEDPSNQRQEFTRVRVRRILEQLSDEGVTPDRLSVAAGRMARARAALESATQELVRKSAQFYPAGYCEIGLDVMRDAPAEISLRALLTLLKWAGGSENVIRLARAERLHEKLIAAGRFTSKTLGGCRVQVVNHPDGQNKGLAGKHRQMIMVCREVAAAHHQMYLAPGTRANWDGRFQVALESDSDSQSWQSTELSTPMVQCLGEAGWRQISTQVSDAARAQIPAVVRPSLPALWDQFGVASVPLMGFQRAGLSPVFGTFSTNFRSTGAAN